LLPYYIVVSLSPITTSSLTAFHSTVQRPQWGNRVLLTVLTVGSVFAHTVPGTGKVKGMGSGTGKDSQTFFNSSLLCATLPNGSSGTQQGLYMYLYLFSWGLRLNVVVVATKTGSQARRVCATAAPPVTPLCAQF